MSRMISFIAVLLVTISPLEAKQKLRKKSCQEYRDAGMTKSGIYYLAREGEPNLALWCDMSSDEYGWAVIQRRVPGMPITFNRNWHYYANGFGIFNESYWLGNENIHQLTTSRPTRLKIDITTFTNQTIYADYGEFYIANATDKYRLTIKNFSGNTNDSMAWHNGKQFSTPDQDHDSSAHGNCARDYEAGWWFTGCFSSNLNGIDNHHSNKPGITWVHARGAERVATCVMKIR